MAKILLRAAGYLFVIGFVVGFIAEVMRDARVFDWGEVFGAAFLSPILVIGGLLLAAMFWRALVLVWKAYLKLDRWLDK